MRGGNRTAVALAILAAACAWWMAVGGEPADPAPSITANPGARPRPPAGDRPPGAAASGSRLFPSPDPAASLPEDLEAAIASLVPGSRSDPVDGQTRGYRRSGYREMPERLRAELRENARKELEPLLDEFRDAGPGPERAGILRRLMRPLREFMACGGGLDLLGLLGESAENGATRDERKCAVIATHTLWQAEVVDWLEERAKSPHDEVRFYAVEGFAWTEGEERPRALENLVRGLEDPAFGVRAIAATSLGLVVADPGNIPALVARLGREEDPRVVRALVGAVLRLDPAGGAARARSAAPGASGEAWAAAEEELARQR